MQYLLAPADEYCIHFYIFIACSWLYSSCACAANFLNRFKNIFLESIENQLTLLLDV